MERPRTALSGGPTSLSEVWQKIYIPRRNRGRAFARVVGWVGFVTVWGACTESSRPAASGDVGVLAVYAQTPDGPVRLRPDRGGAFMRPQDVAFQFSVGGTGPRFVRVELEAAGRRTVLYEEQHLAPASMESLPLVVRLDERHPDTVELTVVVEAPHRMKAVSRFPLRLVGPNTRFWETPAP